MKNIHVLPTSKPSRLAQSAHGYKLHSYHLNYPTQMKFNRHIYITSDEEIKDEDYALYLFDNMIQKVELGVNVSNLKAHKKIILTTDPDLIKDGVQAIDDKFLEWFVKNPSCEFVEVEKIEKSYSKKDFLDGKDCFDYSYKIIIPKEEPKCTCEIGHPYNNLCCKVHGSVSKECRWADIEEGCVNNECECEKKETIEDVALKLFPDESFWIGSGDTSRLYDPNQSDRESWIKGAKWQEQRMYSEEEVHKIVSSYQAHATAFGVKFTYDKWFEQFKKK